MSQLSIYYLYYNNNFKNLKFNFCLPNSNLGPSAHIRTQGVWVTIIVGTRTMTMQKAIACVIVSYLTITHATTMVINPLDANP